MSLEELDKIFRFYVCGSKVYYYIDATHHTMFEGPGKEILEFDTMEDAIQVMHHFSAFILEQD